MAATEEKAFALVVTLAKEYGQMKRLGDSANIERAHGRYHSACEMFAIFTEQTVLDITAVTYARYVEGLGA